jgi:hypothetical protein
MAVRFYGDLTLPYAAVMSHALAAWDYIVAMSGAV